MFNNNIYFNLLLLIISSEVSAQDFSAGGMAGFSQGPGAEAQISASGFAQGFPFVLRFTIGFFTLDPGNPQAAREIFINDATNGVPEENGHFWSFRLDFMYPVK
ncbi:MAG TPA: hypothetical protein PLG50_04220 [bacterium]|nr:hypothetical protein [bacterium]HQG44841.1 hypothetical protein [bacterium]HQJ65791.1 hypothetical protein [bacterium]